jgi:hypothetical protein
MHGNVPHIIHQWSRTSFTARAPHLHTTSPPSELQQKRLRFKMMHMLRTRPHTPSPPQYRENDFCIIRRARIETNCAKSLAHALNEVR